MNYNVVNYEKNKNDILDGITGAKELFAIRGELRKDISKKILNYIENPKTQNQKDQNHRLAQDLGVFMNTLPVEKISWRQIINLKQIDQNRIKSFLSIQNKNDTEKKCIELLDIRDSEGNTRIKLTNKQIFDLVKQDLNDPVVILKMSNSISFAIDGRTRMFVAVALAKDIKTIVLTPDLLAKFAASRECNLF